MFEIQQSSSHRVILLHSSFHKHLVSCSGNHSAALDSHRHKITAAFTRLYAIHVISQTCDCQPALNKQSICPGGLISYLEVLEFVRVFEHAIG